VEGWEGWPLRDHFDGLGGPCVVDNDANAGGLGEALFGAGRGAGCVLYVNIGTGIGGAVIINGRVHRGAHSAAGEIGHCVVLPGGPVCTCGKRGCLEALCSGMSLGRRATEAAEGDPQRSADWPREDDGTVRAETVFERAAAGDPLARELLAETVHYLALGLAIPANVLDPDVIVLGGGVPAAGELLLGPLRAAVCELATEALAPALRLEQAQLGYDAGVIGAAALAMQADPSWTQPAKGDADR
jgi:glucokinase